MRTFIKLENHQRVCTRVGNRLLLLKVSCLSALSSKRLFIIFAFREDLVNDGATVSLLNNCHPRGTRFAH